MDVSMSENLIFVSCLLANCILKDLSLLGLIHQNVCVYRLKVLLISVDLYSDCKQIPS